MARSVMAWSSSDTRYDHAAVLDVPVKLTRDVGAFRRYLIGRLFQM